VTKGGRKTPVRRALLADSSLLPLVADGLGAVQATHRRDHFDAAILSAFADSLELDEAVKPGHEQENRWDYLLGHEASGELVAVEPHSAKQDEITKVIKKQAAARKQLKAHLRDGARVAKWLWVASGKVHFADTERVSRLLDQNGIRFVGTRVAAKHLPSAAESGAPPGKKPRRKGRA
jgi:hypothetical protein